MNTETINQIKEIMQPVADKIGQGAEFGWSVVMRQQLVIAVGGVVMFVVGCILAYIVYRLIKFSIKKYNEAGGRYSSWDLTGGLIGIFGGGTALVLIVAGLFESITHFINPAYYAIQFFIGLVK